MREYLLVAVIAAAVTYLLTPVVRRLALRVGAMATPRDRDVHAFATPRLGGLAMYVGVCAGVLVAMQLPTLSFVFNDSQPLAVLAGGGVILLVGLIDDKWGLDALTKLAGQIAAAGVMVLLGVQLLFVPLPGNTLVLGEERVPLTILAIVVTVNAVNFVDGLDGLAAGLVGIAATALFLFSYVLSQVDETVASPPALIAVLCAGACAGFLPHNFNPARIFMGDSGSMLIGLMLAASATSITGTFPFDTVSGEIGPLLLPLLLPAFVLAVPFADLLLAVVRRTRAGRSPFSPDKLHLHHRLLEIGHTHIRAVLIMYFWTALLAFGAVATSVTDSPGVVLSITGMLAVVAMIMISLPKLRANRQRAAG